MAPSRLGARGPSRAGRQRAAARARRNRVVLAVAVLVSAAIVGAWFPVSTLLDQHAQLASASAQLSRLDQENAALRHQAKELRTPSTLGRIAEQQYDLVPRGDQAYQVLPPSGSGRSDGTLAATGGTGTGAADGRDGSSGSGGSGSGGAPASSGTGSGTGTGAGSASAAPASFVGRVLQTLEFWR